MNNHTMSTRPTDPGPEAPADLQHGWFDTGVQWSARHSGESEAFEKRCRYCGEVTLFGPNRPYRMDACPTRSTDLAERRDIADAQGH